MYSNKGVGMGFGGSGGGGGSISSSSDVSLSNPSDDQVLSYDTSISKWKNKSGNGYSINAQTGTSYTLTLSDANKFITLSNAASITVTVPNNSAVAYPIGTHINLAQLGAGQVSVVAASGVTVSADPGLKIAARYGGAELVKLATNTWLLVGRLSA